MSQKRSSMSADERGRWVPPHPHRTQSAFMKSISTYTWQRAHMHGTKRAHQCLDPTPSHRTSHRTSPPSTMSHAHSPRMEQHGTLDGDPLPNLRPTSLKQVSNHLHAPVPVGARRSRRLPPSASPHRVERRPISFNDVQHRLTCSTDRVARASPSNRSLKTLATRRLESEASKGPAIAEFDAAPHSRRLASARDEFEK